MIPRKIIACGVPLGNEKWFKLRMSQPMPTDKLPIGTLVLATRSDDGDPCDYWTVGTITAYNKEGQIAISNESGWMLATFGKIEQITPCEARQMNMIYQDISDSPGPTLWEHLQRIRKYAGMEDQRDR